MKVVNNRKELVIAKAEEVKNAINSFLGTDFSFSKSSTNFGNSCYIYVKGVFAETMKIRISDHSCGTQRFLSETHVSLHTDVNEFIVNEFEKVLFKERFKEVKEIFEVKEIEVPQNGVTDNDTIIGERVTAKGSTVLKVRRNKYKTVLVRK